ncbi:MAG TPA: protein kinase [Kofleriaceae bacterium]|nr:protein kinase [Kofleriaceae bacterium]
MRYDCPACRRSFEEPGFCPFDRTPLVAAAEQRTVLTEAHTAQPGDLGDTLDDATKKVRAVSATDSASAVEEWRNERKAAGDRLLGETLDGRYVVLRKIGEGGMGVVYAVRHAVIERPLAIKVLKREAMRDSATVRRFVQEAKAASRIGHPNIVDVTDFGTTPDGMTYSVMEFVDGTTLARTIKEAAPMPPERAVRIASQIARALGAAHDKGIVHRDLKPENVFLVDRDGRPDFVKIVDFGIAKVTPAEGAAEGPKLTRQGTIFGTPEYMAPEQATGRGDTDHRVDIYALGTILYEMLCGRVPHKGANVMQTIAMQMLDDVKPPSVVNPAAGVPPPLEAIVMRALAKNRDDRYPKMSDLLAALDGVAGSLAAAAGATLTLAPLPPGADPDITPVPHAPRRAKPPTRPLHEPEFVAAPLSLHHAFEDSAPIARRRPRWPYALAVIALLAAVGAVVVVVLHPAGGDEQAARARRDAAVTARDAEQVAVAPDAQPVEPASDAGVLVLAPRDAGPRGLEPGLGVKPATVRVDILTTPGEADVYIDGHFRGPSGSHVDVPYGKKVQIECRAPHYRGKKTAVFYKDGESAMCVATHIKVCVEGLKNPLEDCEPAGSAGPVLQPRP